MDLEPSESTVAAASVAAPDGNMASRSDLFSQLEALDTAEPLDAESDLILRMAAVSKVRNGKQVRKERNSASKGIAKRRRSKQT